MKKTKKIELSGSDLDLLWLVQVMYSHIGVKSRDRVAHINVTKSFIKKWRIKVTAKVVFYVDRFARFGPTCKMNLVFCMQFTEHVGWQFVDGSIASWEVLGIKVRTHASLGQFHPFSDPDRLKFFAVSNAICQGEGLTVEKLAHLNK